MAAAIRLSQQHSCSFDHLVGHHRGPGGHFKAEGFRVIAIPSPHANASSNGVAPPGLPHA